MLYLSTRDDVNTYTAHIALSRDRAEDGGFFIPFTIPEFTKEDIAAMRKESFNQNMAKILNLFFAARLTGWDMDFYIGKSTCRSSAMTRKMAIAELWHNSDMDFDRAADRLSQRLLQDTVSMYSSWWFKVALRIAALFATYGQVTDEELPLHQSFDFLAPANDMIWPVAATIARMMGLPIATIVCSCREETSVWDLIHKGSLSPAGFTDDMLCGIEALVALKGNCSDAKRFKECCDTRHTYSVGEENPFADGYYCRTNRYLADPETATSFAGLQDYRAGTGAGQVALLISERAPRFYAREIMKVTGVTEQQLMQYTGLQGV